MGHYACDMRPEWFEPEPKAKTVLTLTVEGTPEDFAKLRQALTSKRNPFVRKVALEAERLSKEITL